MANWLSAEQPLLKAINEHLYKSSLMAELNGNIFDKAQVEIQGDTYIVVGETNVVEYPTGTTNKEIIAVTAHVYHRNEANPELTVDETRQYMRWLRFFMQQIDAMTMEHYAVRAARLDVHEVLNDDKVIAAQHGVLRIKYEVWHNVRY